MRPYNQYEYKVKFITMLILNIFYESVKNIQKDLHPASERCILNKIGESVKNVQ